MALFDLNRAGDTPISTLKVSTIVPVNWHRYPPRTAANTPVNVPTVTFTGGAIGDDVSVSTAATTTPYVPKTQAEKATLPGGANDAVQTLPPPYPPQTLDIDYLMVEDITRPRGWMEPDDPLVAKPGAGANPTISSLAPNTIAAGAASPDIIVTITGTNFTAWSTVTSGNFPIPVRYLSPTKLEIVQKPRASVPGIVTVVVTDHGVASAPSNFTFT